MTRERERERGREREREREGEIGEPFSVHFLHVHIRTASNRRFC